MLSDASMLFAGRHTLSPSHLFARFLSNQTKNGNNGNAKKPGAIDAKKQSHIRKPIKASDLLKPFATPSIRATKPDDTHGARPAEPASGQDAIHVRTEISLPASEQKERKAPGSVIESKVLLKHVTKQMSHLSAERRKGSSFSRYTQKLPQPANLGLIASKETKSTADQISKEKHPTTNAVFDAVENLELSLIMSSSPMNQFEEWMQWTLEGKLWKFPIDNEQDWEAERNVPFHEHMFLDSYVDKNLRKSSPVSAFLDLVCSGLAQNPHFTVEQKREHLNWYAAYFKDKLSSIDASVQEELRLAELEKKARAGTSTTAQ